MHVADSPQAALTRCCDRPCSFEGSTNSFSLLCVLSPFERADDSREVTVAHDRHKAQGEGIDRKLHDPISDKLVPLAPLDLSQINSVDSLVRAMGDTAFTGRQVGEGADGPEAIAKDKDCFVVMTLAGAMTVAKQGLIVTELIDRGVVKTVISTGALMAHGLVEAAGRSHFRYDPKMDDMELYEAGYNRVYDTLEPETNLDFVETHRRRASSTQWDAQ